MGHPKSRDSWPLRAGRTCTLESFSSSACTRRHLGQSCSAAKPRACSSPSTKSTTPQWLCQRDCSTQPARLGRRDRDLHPTQYQKVLSWPIACPHPDERLRKQSQIAPSLSHMHRIRWSSCKVKSCACTLRIGTRYVGRSSSLARSAGFACGTMNTFGVRPRSLKLITISTRSRLRAQRSLLLLSSATSSSVHNLSKSY